jgi:hypothetical protein
MVLKRSALGNTWLQTQETYLSESDPMFERAIALVTAIWKRFRSFPFFVQLLLVIPVLCAMALTLLVGNMGLALMGTAVAINSLVAGWIGGVLVLVLGKAGIIVAKDRHNKS